MSCCKVQVSGEMHDKMVGFGFDPQWTIDIVSKYGPQILDVISECISSGFTVATVVDILGKFGPTVLEFLKNLLGKKVFEGVVGEVVADNVGAIDISLIETLVQKYLPAILDKYGSQIVQLLITYLMNYLQSVVKSYK